MLAILLALLLEGATAPWQGASRPATISGQVVDATTNAPVADANISIARNRLVLTQTTSDAEGRFVFPDLEAGSYTVAAFKDGFLRGSYAQAEAMGAGAEVDVTSGEQRANVTIRLWQPSTLAGSIRDEAGRPLANVKVRALPLLPSGGRMRALDDDVTQSGGTTATSDAEGAFQFTELRPATYIVFVPSEMVFYPGVLSAGAANRLTLAPGEARQRVDVTLPRVRLASLSGGVVGTRIGHSIRVTLHLVEPDFDFTVGSTAAAIDGSFRFTSVPPGSYEIRVTDFPVERPFPLVLGLAWYLMPRPAGDMSPIPPATSVGWAHVFVTVDQKDISDLLVTLAGGYRIAGRVVFDGAIPPPEAEQLLGDTMIVFAIDAGGVASPISGIKADATFLTVGLPPGKYQIVQMGRLSAMGWSIRSIRHAGREIYGEPIDISGGDASDLVVTLTDHPSVLTGVVRNERADPMPGVSVLLFPTDRRTWVDFGPSPVRLREVRTARDGSFRLAGVIPGEYYLVGLTGPAAANWPTAETMESLAPLAVTVRIGAAQDVQQALRARPWR